MSEVAEVTEQIEAEEIEQVEKVETPEGFVPIEQNQEEVNKQHRKFRDAERVATAAQAKADALQKELDEVKSQSVDLTVPTVDPFSETFEADLKTRDEAIQRVTTHNATVSNLETEQQKTHEAKIAQDEAALKEKVASFDSNMLTLGLKPIDVKQAADTVINYGISDTFQDVLLEHPEGPLLVQYLANNPIELEAVNGMSVLQMVDHLKSDIGPKASLLKPKTSQAPDPPITLDGGGVGEVQEPWEDGVKYS